MIDWPLVDLTTAAKVGGGLLLGLFTPRVLRELRLWYRTLRFGKVTFDRDVADRTIEALQRLSHSVESERDSLDRQLREALSRYENLMQERTAAQRKNDEKLVQGLFWLLGAALRVEVRDHNLLVQRDKLATPLRDLLARIRSTPDLRHHIKHEELAELDGLLAFIAIAPQLDPHSARELARAALLVADATSSSQRSLGAVTAALARTHLGECVREAVALGSPMQIGKALLATGSPAAGAA